MDVSIVIVNWNTRDLLRGCLRSIYDQSKSFAYEVIVIDNASSDGSIEMLRVEFPDVHAIANDQNRGFAAANNQGIRLAKGRYVLLLNPDTVILDHAIDRCIRFADTHPDIGVVGCQVLEDGTRIQRTGFCFPSPWNLLLTLAGLPKVFPGSRLFDRPELGWWKRDSQQDIDVISGMFMLTRRKAIEQVGLMDECYFVYAEEADWCYRFFRMGWRRVFFPEAKIVHLDGGGKSTSQVNIKMFVQLQKSILIYHKKNLGLASWLTSRVIYIVSNAVRALGWSTLSFFIGNPAFGSRASAATAALRFHLFGIEPK